MELIAALIHQPKRFILMSRRLASISFAEEGQEFLKYYNEQFGASILLTSHYMKDVEDLCKRTIIINEGSILYDGDLHKINDLLTSRKL